MNKLKDILNERQKVGNFIIGDPVQGVSSVTYRSPRGGEDVMVGSVKKGPQGWTISGIERREGVPSLSRQDLTKIGQRTFSMVDDAARAVYDLWFGGEPRRIVLR